MIVNPRVSALILVTFCSLLVGCSSSRQEKNLLKCDFRIIDANDFSYDPLTPTVSFTLRIACRNPNAEEAVLQKSSVLTLYVNNTQTVSAQPESDIRVGARDSVEFDVRFHIPLKSTVESVGGALKEQRAEYEIRATIYQVERYRTRSYDVAIVKGNWSQEIIKP